MKLYIKALFHCRQWPNPVLLKTLSVPGEHKLGFPIWDPRVRNLVFVFSTCKCALWLPFAILLLLKDSQTRTFNLGANLN